MKYSVVRKQEQRSAIWAGGTTTQLFIYPEGTEYTKFNFIFRLSSATVEVEKSTFTFMPGVTRHLMILNGELHIHHTDHYSKQLNKYDVDVFNGEWPTTAEGKVVDFNLMTRGGAEGNLAHYKLNECDKKTITVGGLSDFLAFYVNEGKLEISFSEFIALEEGDFLIVENNGKENISFHLNGSCDVIVADLSLSK